MTIGRRPITRSYARALFVAQRTMVTPLKADEDIEATFTSDTPERQRADRFFAVAMLALLALTFWAFVSLSDDAA